MTIHTFSKAASAAPVVAHVTTPKTSGCDFEFAMGQTLSDSYGATGRVVGRCQTEFECDEYLIDKGDEQVWLADFSLKAV